MGVLRDPVVEIGPDGGVRGKLALNARGTCDTKRPMFRKPAAVFIVFLLASLLPPLAAGEADEKESGTPRWIFSFAERIRQESSDNVASLDESKTDSSSYMRMRTNLAVSWKPAETLAFRLRLANEIRYYLSPKTDPKLGINFGLNEVVIDQLYARWDRPAGLPLALTVGRQDIQMGEGFVLMDGGPGDGSRTAYFNGARADVTLASGQTLTAFYVNQPRTDRFLPRLNDVGQIMVEQDEESYGLYHTGGFGKTKFEAYLFRLNRERRGLFPGAGFQTAGGRVQAPLAGRLSLTAEGALQFGRREDDRKTGFGGYARLDYATGAAGALPATLTLGGIWLSGDDPATAGKDEGWDPAFGRWPKWSDSLIYLFARETRAAYWSNFTSLYGSLGFAPVSNVKLALTWHRLGAAERTMPSELWSGRGTRRGDLGILKVVYEISPHWQGHFLWEHFRPGDFYFSGARGYAWIRFELLIRY